MILRTILYQRPTILILYQCQLTRCFYSLHFQPQAAALRDDASVLSVGSRVSFSSHVSVGARALQAAGGGYALQVSGSCPRSAQKLRAALEEEKLFEKKLEESRDKQIHVTVSESAKSKDMVVAIDKNTKDALDRSAKRYVEDLEDAKNRRLGIKYALIDAEAEAEATPV